MGKRLSIVTISLGVVSATCSFISPAAAAPNADATNAFLGLQIAMSALHDRTQVDEHFDATAVASLQSKVDTMQAALLGPRTGGLDSKYLRAIDLDARIVSRAAAEPDVHDSDALIAAVQDDLALKIQFADASVAAQSQVPGLVHVTVTTTHNGAVVSGYLIQCNPKMWDNPTTAQVAFPQPTSPTAYDLVPGNWVFYALKGGTRVQSQPVSVGGDTQPAEAVTIVIP